MKNKKHTHKKTAANIHVHAAPSTLLGTGAVLKIPTCASCHAEVVWIGGDWYHARAPEYHHRARAGQGRTLYVADYSSEAAVAA